MGWWLADDPGSDWVYGRNLDAQSNSAARSLMHAPWAASAEKYQDLTWVDGFARFLLAKRLSERAQAQTRRARRSAHLSDPRARRRAS